METGQALGAKNRINCLEGAIALLVGYGELLVSSDTYLRILQSYTHKVLSYVQTLEIEAVMISNYFLRIDG